MLKEKIKPRLVSTREARKLVDPVTSWFRRWQLDEIELNILNDFLRVGYKKIPLGMGK